MKIIKIIISVLFISLFNLTFSYAEDCSKYDKLSKDYAKCTSDKLKKETSQKAEEIKSKTAKKIKEKASDEINKGKKKLNKSGLGEKIDKFKKSKTLSDLIKG